MKLFMQLIAVLSVFAVCLGFAGCKKTENDSPHSYDEVYTVGDAALDVNADGAFTILKLNDTHLFNGTNADDLRTLADIRAVLEKTPCDLIVIAGDMVEGKSIKHGYDKYGAAGLLGALLEEFNTPWTFAPGNNDGERGGTKQELIAFMMQYPHFLYGNARDITGTMQFFIDLKKDGETVHAVAIIDSLERNSKGKYDFMKTDQIAWLVAGANERAVPTSVFFHMPTPAFKAAYENGEAFPGFPFGDEYPVDNIEGNRLFDDMTADCAYITLLSCAHVHSDNMAYLYGGRWYQLSSLGGYGAIGSDNYAPSYTVTVIDTNAVAVRDMYTFSKVSAE